MPTDCAICYVSDDNFLMPTLISAAGIRKYIPAEKAAIYIFVIHGSDERCEELADNFDYLDINILPMSGRVFAEYASSDRQKFHIPLSALGRLFIADFLPGGHKRILYLDGDTYITADPTPLVGYELKVGRFAAAEDISYFRRGDLTSRGKALRNYFGALGINPDDGYFNSGVFLVDVETWITISKDALAFFKNHAKYCLFYDQCALNAVVGNKRDILSLRWNFQTPFRFFQLESKLSPRILHFTEFPKPWMGRIEPWKDMFSVYEQHCRNKLFSNLSRHRLSREKIRLHNSDVTWSERSKFRYVRRSVRNWIKRRAIWARESRVILNGSSS